MSAVCNENPLQRVQGKRIVYSVVERLLFCKPSTLASCHARTFYSHNLRVALFFSLLHEMVHGSVLLLFGVQGLKDNHIVCTSDMKFLRFSAKRYL